MARDRVGDDSDTSLLYSRRVLYSSRSPSFSNSLHAKRSVSNAYLIAYLIETRVEDSNMSC